MWIIQLLLAWALLYWAFRLMIGIGGKQDKNGPPSESGSGFTDSDSDYISNNPDVLRPEIQPDEFDPTEYF